MTSVSTSFSILFFCFFITASSSDTFSLSWRTGAGVGVGNQDRIVRVLSALPGPGLGTTVPAHLQQRALHRDLAIHARPLLGAKRPKLLLRQREQLSAAQFSQRRDGPEQGY